MTETFEIPNGRHITCRVVGCGWKSTPFPGSRPPEHIREQTVRHVIAEHPERYRAAKLAEGGEGE